MGHLLGNYSCFYISTKSIELFVPAVGRFGNRFEEGLGL